METNEVRLQKMFLETNKMFHQQTIDKFMVGNEPTFTKFVMDNIDGMCWNLHSWVWARKPDRKEVIVGNLAVPKNWFQHLKADIIYKFPRLARLINLTAYYKSVEIKKEIELQTFYPTMNILNHEPYLNVVEVKNASERIDRYTEEV